MSRAFAASNPGAAFLAQNRTMALTIALSVPCFVAFLLVPDILMRAAFVRGRFSVSDAEAAARVLAAYSAGLLPIVLIASARASFQSRGDTTTPMAVALAAVVLNVALKIVLFQPFGAPGLAIATACGAWINVVGLLGLASRGGWFKPDATLGRIAVASLAAGGALALALFLAREPLLRAVSAAGSLSDILAVIGLGVLGMVVYALVFLVAVQIMGVHLARLRPPRRTRSREDR